MDVAGTLRVIKSVSWLVRRTESIKPYSYKPFKVWGLTIKVCLISHVLLLSPMQQELVYYTLSRAPGAGYTAALSVLLQRCNEVQQWVMSEVLMCVSLNKRVQLLKKFIKIAAQWVRVLLVQEHQHSVWLNSFCLFCVLHAAVKPKGIWTLLSPSSWVLTQLLSAGST